MKPLAAFLILMLSTGGLFAQTTNRITAKITVTTATSNNFAFTLNGSTRTFTNNVTAAASQITTNHTVAGSASNFYHHVIASPFSGPVAPLSYTNGSNVIFLRGALGQAMSVTILSNWATVEYSTQVFSSGVIDVRVPMASLGSGERIKLASELVTGINAYTTNAFATNSPALTNHLSLGPQVQRASNKVFEASHVTGSIVTNSSLTNITRANIGGLRATNLIAHNASLTNVTLNTVSAYNFNAPGSGTDSQKIGTNSNASGQQSLALGVDADASADLAIAIGATAANSGQNGIALGYGAINTGTLGISIGAGSVNSNYAGISIGLAAVTNDYTVIISPGSGGSLNTSSFGPMGDNQIWLGSSSESVWIPGATHFQKSIFFTNAWATNIHAFAGAVSNVNILGTNVIAGAISHSRTNITTLANGGNDLDPGLKTYLKVSGPSAAYSIDKIDRGYDGRFLRIQKSDSFTLTIPNESGFGALGNSAKILTGTGGTLSITNNPGFVELTYDSAVSRWVVIRASN